MDVTSSPGTSIGVHAVGMGRSLQLGMHGCFSGMVRHHIDPVSERQHGELHLWPLVIAAQTTDIVNEHNPR